MTLYLCALLVFSTTFMSAWCWVYYIRHCEQRHAAKAAWCDVAIIALGLVSFVGVVDDWRLAVPTLGGAWLGTYCVVRAKQ